VTLKRLGSAADHGLVTTVLIMLAGGWLLVMLTVVSVCVAARDGDAQLRGLDRPASARPRTRPRRRAAGDGCEAGAAPGPLLAQRRPAR
jgi:hypothetical protein